MKVNSKWLAALLLLVVIPLCGCGFISKLQSRDNLNKGVKQFTDQNYDAAADYFKKAIELDPDFPKDVPRMYLATSYMSQFVPGSIDAKSEDMGKKAIETFSQVVDRSIKEGEPNIGAMLAIASLSYQMKNIEQTKEWCNKVLEIQPKTNEIKQSQAEAHYRIAVIDFDAVNEKTGTVGENVEFLNPEEKKLVQEYIDEGLESLGKAVEIRPNYFDAMMYQNLLWREKAKMEQDEDAKLKLINQADRAYSESIKLKLKAQVEEAKKPKKLGSLNE
jgi:tetratricopeptide (TPR) repeat protein